MATTSFLYHAQALRGYKHLRTEYHGGCDFHHIELAPHKRRCANPDCNARWWKLTLAGTFERTEAKKTLTRAIELLEDKYPAAAERLVEAEDDVLAYMSFPEKHWRQIHSTNPLERLNKEIRRRTNVVGIFPTDASTLRLIGMLLVEQNDEWAVGRRYFSISSMKLMEQPAEEVKGILAA